MDSEPEAADEFCEACGFVWDQPDLEEIRTRLSAAGETLSGLFATGSAQLAVRPSAEVWSPVEYGAHTRDVLLNLRDRIIVGLGEENPSPKPMYGTLRIERGLYQLTDPAELALDLAVASRLLVRTIAVLTPTDAERPIFYGWPRPATRTLRWVAAQALHEAEHHLEDIETTLGH